MLPPCDHQTDDQAFDATVAVDSYLVDHLQFMQEQEETTYQIPPSADYLRKPYSTVTSADRRTMLEWSYDIVRACAISREIACVGAQYFDRFLCTPSRRARAAAASRREFQLAFIACVVIALKCRAGMKVEAAFVSETICQKLYDEAEVLGMERDVLSALQWRLNGPSPHEFVAGLVALLPPSAACTTEGRADGDPLAERLTALANAQVELAMLDYSTALRQSPSSIAYEALMAAMQSIGTDGFLPLDRLAWIGNIDLVTNSKPKDCGAPTRPIPALSKLVPWCSAVSSSTPGSPLPSSIQYLDMLSIADSKQYVTEHASPVSSMLDDF